MTPRLRPRAGTAEGRPSTLSTPLSLRACTGPSTESRSPRGRHLPAPPLSGPTTCRGPLHPRTGYALSSGTSFDDARPARIAVVLNPRLRLTVYRRGWSELAHRPECMKRLAWVPLAWIGSPAVLVGSTIGEVTLLFGAPARPSGLLGASLQHAERTPACASLHRVPGHGWLEPGPLRPPSDQPGDCSTSNVAVAGGGEPPPAPKRSGLSMTGTGRARVRVQIPQPPEIEALLNHVEKGGFGTEQVSARSLARPRPGRRVAATALPSRGRGARSAHPSRPDADSSRPGRGDRETVGDVVGYGEGELSEALSCRCQRIPRRIPRTTAWRESSTLPATMWPGRWTPRWSTPTGTSGVRLWSTNRPASSERRMASR